MTSLGRKALFATALLLALSLAGNVLLAYSAHASHKHMVDVLKKQWELHDLISGDGLYSSTLPGQASGTMIGFRIEARDVPNVLAKFPAEREMYPGDTEKRECLVRFGEVQPAGVFGVYRIWCSWATIDKWTNRGKQHNSPLDATFVYGNYRFIYDAGARYGGSGYTAATYDTPTGKLSHYSLSFPEDDRFLGSAEAILEFPPYDVTAQLEKIAYWMANEMGLPFNHRRSAFYSCPHQRRWSN